MKTSLALAVFVALTWIDRVDAQPGQPVRQPTEASTRGLCEEFSPKERAHLVGEAERAEAQARMEALYKRLADHADRAIRSICNSCQPERPFRNPPWRLVALSEQSENIVDDPAQAPDY